MNADPAAPSADNPLLEPSALPLQLPPFAAITLEHCREGVLAGMAEQRAEGAAVVASPGPPTFEDTVGALERAGRLYRRAGPGVHNLPAPLATDRDRKSTSLNSSH